MNTVYGWDEPSQGAAMNDEADGEIHRDPPRLVAREGRAPGWSKKIAAYPHSEFQMFFDKFSHGFVGISNFLRIAAFKPMFSIFDWDKGERNALLLKFLRHHP